MSKWYTGSSIKHEVYFDNKIRTARININRININRVNIN